jgi:hypothetical protein
LSLQKIAIYDKELRQLQASLRVAYKDIKILGDQLGEQIFNLEEKCIVTV